MTLPDERRRNLIWGQEALEGLSTDAGVSSAWRIESAELLGRYPSVNRLRNCSDDALGPLQIEYANVLARTKALFQRIRVSPDCSAQRKYALLVILRHFY